MPDDTNEALQEAAMSRYDAACAGLGIKAVARKPQWYDLPINVIGAVAVFGLIFPLCCLLTAVATAATRNWD